MRSAPPLSLSEVNTSKKRPTALAEHSIHDGDDGAANGFYVGAETAMPVEGGSGVPSRSYLGAEPLQLCAAAVFLRRRRTIKGGLRLGLLSKTTKAGTAHQEIHTSR